MAGGDEARRDAVDVGLVRAVRGRAQRHGTGGGRGLRLSLNRQAPDSSFDPYP
jgi:hypothetical protein